jgi:hypothetical protein
MASAYENIKGTNCSTRLGAGVHVAAVAKHAVSPHQLKIQALMILYKLAHHRKADPYDRSWALRFLLAFLYSQASGDDRSPFDAFWKAATRPGRPGEPEETAARVRGTEMKRLANQVCLAVGEEPKPMQDRFWDELTREAYARRGEKVRILK